MCMTYNRKLHAVEHDSAHAHWQSSPEEKAPRHCLGLREGLIAQGTRLLECYRQGRDFVLFGSRGWQAGEALSPDSRKLSESRIRADRCHNYPAKH